MSEERDSFEWSTSTWRGLEHHECTECPFDTFGTDSRPKMLAHCRRANHGRVINGALRTDEWIELELAQANLVQGHKVSMGQLCWNTAEISAEAALALHKECQVLARLGNEGRILTIDNGSQDDTLVRVVTTLNSAGNQGFQAVRNIVNKGISAARNVLIDMALSQGAEYLLMIDGDIEPVPISVYTMMRYLDCHDKVGCIGAYSASYTKDRTKTTKALTCIQENRVKDNIEVAWTQYGLFRMSMFQSGIRFDESGPFGQPGWGFEDDDLALQMYERGWQNKYFGGMTYLHRNIRSSWVHIENQGFSVKEMFNKRKDFLINKWHKRGYDSAKLHIVGAQQLPMGVF